MHRVSFPWPWHDKNPILPLDALLQLTFKLFLLSSARCLGFHLNRIALQLICADISFTAFNRPTGIYGRSAMSAYSVYPPRGLYRSPWQHALGLNHIWWLHNTYLNNSVSRTPTDKPMFAKLSSTWFGFA